MQALNEWLWRGKVNSTYSELAMQIAATTKKTMDFCIIEKCDVFVNVLQLFSITTFHCEVLIVFIIFYFYSLSINFTLKIHILL